MPTPCYLSLSSNGGVLTSVEDIVPTVLRMVLGQPGETSEWLEDYKVSFRVLESKWGTDPSLMCSKLSDAMRAIYRRYFPDLRLQVNCTYEMIDESERYNLIIDIIAFNDDGTTVGLISNRKIEIDPTTNKFTINYNTATNQTIRVGV